MKRTPKKKTVGQVSLEAKANNTVYDPIEVGEALTQDILDEVWKCIDSHHSKIDEPEFCIIMLRASDPLIQGVMRRKFYAWPFLPKPRPEQLVFHYRKSGDMIQRLWSLPSAKVMAVMSELRRVSPKWKETKAWCDAFYRGFEWSKKQNKWVNTDEKYFYDMVRVTAHISMPTESEYLNAHRAELIKAGYDGVESPLPDTFDFSKIAIEKVIDPVKSLSD